MTERDTTNQPLGEYLRNRRNIKGETLRGIGGSALSSGYLNQIETGRIQEVSVAKLITLAQVYDVPVIALLRDVYGVDADPDATHHAEAVAIGNAVQALPELVRERTVDWIKYQAEKSQANISSETQ